VGFSLPRPPSGGLSVGFAAAQPLLRRRTLLDGGFTELPIQASHVLAVARLPPLHRDPFDRLLLAQAESEGPVRHQSSF
jgi:hypothetical protein